MAAEADLWHKLVRVITALIGMIARSGDSNCALAEAKNLVWGERVAFGLVRIALRIWRNLRRKPVVLGLLNWTSVRCLGGVT